MPFLEIYLTKKEINPSFPTKKICLNVFMNKDLDSVKPSMFYLILHELFKFKDNTTVLIVLIIILTRKTDKKSMCVHCVIWGRDAPSIDITGKLCDHPVYFCCI